MEQFPTFDKHLTKEITGVTFKYVDGVQINYLLPQIFSLCCSNIYYA